MEKLKNELHREISNLGESTVFSPMYFTHAHTHIFKLCVLNMYIWVNGGNYF